MVCQRRVTEYTQILVLGKLTVFLELHYRIFIRFRLGTDKVPADKYLNIFQFNAKYAKPRGHAPASFSLQWRNM